MNARLARPLVIALIVILIATHMLLVHLAISHASLPLWAVGAIVVVVLLQHLGVLTPLLARRRRK